MYNAHTHFNVYQNIHTECMNKARKVYSINGRTLEFQPNNVKRHTAYSNMCCESLWTWLRIYKHMYLIYAPNDYT